MHGQHYGHADIVRRQGLLDGLGSGLLGGNDPAQPPSNVGTDPLGLGSVIGGVTSALLPSQSSESSSFQSSVSLTSPTRSSSVSSESSSSSISSSPSTSITPSSTSSTPSPTSTSSASIITSSSDGIPVTVTATVPASSSNPATLVSPSFLQNKPLEAGVFSVVGIIGGIIILLVVIVWIRSNGRRRLNREALDPSSWNPAAMYGVRDDGDRSSMEKLTRWNSTSSATHTQTTDHTYGTEFGQGSYPVPPVPLPSPARSVDGHGQLPVYHDQASHGPVYNSEYKHVPPRSPNPVHDPTRSPPNNDSHLDKVNPILPPSQNVAAQRRGTQFDFSPALPTSGQAQNRLSRRPSSHLNSRTLNPRMQEMPVAPPLPPKFGSDEAGESEPYSGIDNDVAHSIHRALKVANL